MIMIFVTVGSEWFPFDRLIRAVDELARRGALRDVFCQIGISLYKPQHCLWERFLTFSEMLAHIRRSELVIAHGGAAIALLCLKEGKIPILVPRRKEFKEHVDDHQVEFAARLEALGKAVMIEEVGELEGALERQRRLQEEHFFAEESLKHTDESPLCRELNELLHSWDRGGEWTPE